MIGDHDAVDPERHARLRVGGVQDALHHEWPLPALAIARDLVPGESAPHFAPHEGRDLVHVRGVGGIGLEIAEARLPVPPQRPEVAGRSEDAGKHPQVRPERRGDAYRDLARARGAHGNIEGEHEHVHAGGFGPAHQVEADRVLVAGAAVELEPQHVGGDLGRALDGHPSNQAERIRHTRALRRRGEILIGARPHDRGAAHGRNADRRGIAPPEQLHIDRRQGGGDAVARYELDRVERAPVARDAAVLPGAAVEIFEGEARDVPAGMPAQISDGREAAVQLDETRIVGRGIGRGRTHQGSRVVHALSLPFSRLSCRRTLGQPLGTARCLFRNG
jgi:hypothetical protein